jgi:hypothetical protein
MFVFTAFLAYPCSCADPSQREKFRSANAVFLGKAIEIKEYTDPDKDFQMFIQTVKFEVRKQWKGAKKPEIVALAAFDLPGWCGDLNLTVGESYLIYAAREKGRLLVYTDCGPNRNVKYAWEEIKQLKNFWFRFFARLYPYPQI